ncbi:hypothetical protein P7C71_g4277, partial [Lecanoromycetidae sp. Uapishka_2]
MDPLCETIKISDWGSGKVNTYRSGTGSEMTPSPRGTVTYEPPDYMLDGKTSRPYDVWSLGCVLLELLVWALCGSKAVEDFRNDREARRDLTSTAKWEDDAFWQKDTRGYIALKEVVNRQIQKLEYEAIQQDLKAFKAVSDLIKTMFEIDRATRIKARDVEDTLDRIYRRTKVEFENPDSVPAENDSEVPQLSTKVRGRAPTGSSFSPSAPSFGSASSGNVSPTDLKAPSSKQEPTKRGSFSELKPYKAASYPPRPSTKSQAKLVYGLKSSISR